MQPTSSLVCVLACLRTRLGWHTIMPYACASCLLMHNAQVMPLVHAARSAHPCIEQTAVCAVVFYNEASALTARSCGDPWGRIQLGTHHQLACACRS